LILVCVGLGFCCNIANGSLSDSYLNFLCLLLFWHIFSMETSFSVGLVTTSSACGVSKHKGGLGVVRATVIFFHAQYGKKPLQRLFVLNFAIKCTRCWLKWQANWAASRDADLQGALKYHWNNWKYGGSESSFPHMKEFL